MVASKRISPGVYEPLQEALASIYWYKPDLRRFLRGVFRDEPELLQNLDWDQYKIAVVGDLIGRLQSRESTYQDRILELMSQVSDFRSFEHLRRLDDGERKVERAQAAVNALREWVEPHEEQIAAAREAEKRRQKWRDEDLGKQRTSAKLSDLKTHFYTLHGTALTHQRRGSVLESLLRDLFELADLDPRRSFTLKGEQIDGAFTYDGTDYIVEAKWTKDRIEPKELRDFQGKVAEKLDNTLGLFVSINGFTDNAASLHLGYRPNVILWNGADLNAVLEERIDLAELLRRKRRHAAHTGEIYLPISQVLVEG